MSQRMIERGVFSPDELSLLSRAFGRACGECNFNGSAGRLRLAKSLMTMYRHGRTEAELVQLAKTIIKQWRGLEQRESAA